MELKEMVYAAGGFVFALLITIVGYFMKRKDDTADKEKESSQKDFKELGDKMHSLTLSITELNVTIKFLMQRTDKIPELEKDLNALGQKFRDMKN